MLAEYFCLRTNDLVALVYGEQTEIHQASMRRTLSILRRQGLINRLPYLSLDLETGGITYVHGLSDRGLLFGVRHSKTFDEHSQRTLDHELEISFFHIALKRFCDTNGLHLYWQQRDLKTKTIAPDALFAITDPKKPEGKNTLYYFLEIERSKIGNIKNGEPSIIRKLSKYYDYFNSDLCEKEWKSFRQFRVIIVQRTEAKRDFLLSSLKEKYAHRMFWLTTEPLYKQDMSAEIFKTPKDADQRSYSFLVA